MGKGEETREAVLREALAQSSQVGLRGITIGGLAGLVGGLAFGVWMEQAGFFPLVAGIVASGIAVVFQSDNLSPRWSVNATAELRSAAIEAGMTAPEADCFVRAITSRYHPTEDVDPAVVQQIANSCR